MQASRILICVLAISTIPYVSASDLDAEDVFNKAKHYTVEVKASIETPIFDDKVGLVKGAGFLVDSDRGWILTNNHVSTMSQSRISVRFMGEREIQAKRIYIDTFHDLAILQVDAKKTMTKTAAELDCVELPGTGHPVGAYGHPWGFKYTGTMGVVSGVTSKHGRVMLQTDAPINGGNSGGPLISIKTGRVVGMNTSKIADERDQNTNFAEPMKYACKMLSLLDVGKRPLPPKLSVSFIDDSSGIEQLKVAKVWDFDTFWFVVGDVIQKINGKGPLIKNETDLIHSLRGAPGEVAISVMRGGHEVDLLGTFPQELDILSYRAVNMSSVIIGAIELDKELSSMYETPVVLAVKQGTYGEFAGFEAFDMITHVNNRPVANVDELLRILKDVEKNDNSTSFTVRSERLTDNSYYTYKELRMRTVSVDEISISGI